MAATGHTIEDADDPSDLQLFTCILRDTVEGFVARDRLSRRRKRESGPDEDGDTGAMGTTSLKRCLVDSHTRLKTAQIIFLAAQRQWHGLSRRAEYLEGVLARRALEASIDDNSGSSRAISLSPKEVALRVLSIASLLLSILVLWCEATVSLDGILESPLGHMIDTYDAGKDGKSTLGIQVTCFMVLAYMALCTFYSLFNVNIAGVEYSLSPQSSPPSSLLVNAIYFSRLQFSIGFNFVILCGSNRLEHMCFDKLMQVRPLYYSL